MILFPVTANNKTIQRCFFKWLLCYCIIFCYSFSALSQDKTSDGDNLPEQIINFGWTKRVSEKSFEPYYKALKGNISGEKRFDIIEKLIEHHIKKSNTDSILNYANLYKRDIDDWEETKAKKQYYYAKSHYYLGKGSFMSGLFDNAIKWYIKGIQDTENNNFKAYNYKNRLGLANCYIFQDNIDKAIIILNQTLLDFPEEYQDVRIYNHILLGKAHRFKGEYTKADEYYNKALVNSDSLNVIELQLTTRLELAKLTEAKGELEIAFQAYEKIRNEAKSKGFDALFFEGTLLAARTFYIQEYYQEAIIGLSMAYINAIESNNLYFQRELLILQARCFYKQENHKSAYNTMTQLFRVVNQIKNKQQQEIIKELEIQYETLEKEKAISTLEDNQIKKEVELTKQKTIRNAFLIGFIVILIPIIALLYTYYQKIQTQILLNTKQGEINDQKVASLKQEQELNLIKATIEGQDEERKRIAQELHDSIGGNLAGIKLQLSSIENKPEILHTVSSQLNETYQLVRDISHTLTPKKFRQNKFTSLVYEYIKTINITGKITVDFYPHPKVEINALNDKIHVEFFKIIQELMTNTLKHAQARKVDIYLNLIENTFSLLFEDNGVGFTPNTTTDGIGFKNIKNRIELLNGSLHLDTAPTRGTIIAIEIPL